MTCFAGNVGQYIGQRSGRGGGLLIDSFQKGIAQIGFRQNADVERIEEVEPIDIIIILSRRQ